VCRGGLSGQKQALALGELGERLPLGSTGRCATFVAEGNAAEGNAAEGNAAEGNAVQPLKGHFVVEEGERDGEVA
jgi:DNA gyrase/topoisomerase IV subunit B